MADPAPEPPREAPLLVTYVSVLCAVIAVLGAFALVAAKALSP